LSNLVDLEFFSLSFHLFKENCQICWDLFRADKILRILTNIELLTDVTTHLVDLAN